jgi:predicted O-methyltransferase YrrM
MEFLPAEIEQYAISHTKPEDGVLAELNRETWAKVLRPRMLSGHLQGKVLETFSYMIQPQTILEVGTYTGYSAICMARGLAPGGKLITLDINDEIAHIAQHYFEKAGFADRIHMQVGDAREIIPTLQHTWDLVFIDADKENYGLYFDLIFNQLRPGGFIIADNVLWSGKVMDAPELMDDETKSLVDFNMKVLNDDRVENVLMPIRDGLMVIRKK